VYEDSTPRTANVAIGLVRMAGLDTTEEDSHHRGGDETAVGVAARICSDGAKLRYKGGVSWIIGDAQGGFGVRELAKRADEVGQILVRASLPMFDV